MSLSQQLTSVSMYFAITKMPALRVSKLTVGKSSITIVPAAEEERKDSQYENRGSAVR